MISPRLKSDLKSANDQALSSNTTSAQAQIHYYVFLFIKWSTPGVRGSLMWGFKERLNIRTCRGTKMQRHSILCRVFLEPHCAKEDASLIWSLRAGAGERTWFLCRAPSSSSDAVFMVPHRSFTILWRICAFGPPVPGCARQSRVSSCYSSYSIQKENWVSRVKRSLRLQPRKLRTEIPPVAPAWPRVIPRNRMKYLQAPVRVTWSTIASDRDSEEKKKANLTSCHRQNKPAQSLYSTKEITKSFLAQITFLSVCSRFQDTSRRHFSPRPTDQVRMGWDGTRPHVCRVPVTCLRGYQTPISSPGETDSDSSVGVRLI